MRLPPADRMEAALEQLEALQALLEDVGTDADQNRNLYDSAFSRALLKAHGGNAESRKAEAYLACEDLAHDLKVAEGKLDRVKMRIRSNHEVLNTLRSLNLNQRVVT